MNISRRWLEAFLQRRLDAQDVANRLVMLGAGVDAIEPLHPGLEQVVVGLVESAQPHPNADRLRVCLVNDGSGQQMHVVCGAPNVTAGKKYPFARVGTTLPGGITLDRRKIRGETSEGMLCSARELGLGQDHDGILELDTDAAPGTPLLDALPVDDDRLVLDVTPNRPDLLGHKGVARELAYSYNTLFRLPEIPGAPAEGLGTLRRIDANRGKVDGVTVGTDDPEGCRRFTAVVIRGVKVGPSPAWLRDRLAAVGVRSISNVVDATNYAMLELNHPMHAYDLAKVRGNEVVARRARNGEKVVTLDGVERNLTHDMVTIADAEGSVGVGGVMGGANTEVGQTTSDLLLECAWFEPRRVRRARKALNLPTDASHRFERGVDLWGLPEAQRRLADLIVATAGGKVIDGVDVWPIMTNPPRIFLRVARVHQLLGASLPVSAMEKYLLAVGCTVLYKPGDERLAVDVPGWRPDLEGEVDLIEEIARLHGYDNFPIDLRPYRVGKLGDGPLDNAINQVRHGLIELGLLEATLIPMGPPEGPESVRLINPLSAEDSHLRQTLLPGLARAVETNWSRQNRDIRLFEVGVGFKMAGVGQRPDETMRVAGVLTGARSPAHWTDGGKAAEFDLWDLEAMFQAAVALANPAAQVQLDTGGWVARTADGRLAGRAVQVDLVPPAWAAPVFGFEIEIAADARQPVRYAPLPTTPSAWRDVTLVLGSGVSAARVEGVMRTTAGRLLEAVSVISEFRSAQMGENLRAVQYRMVFRAADRTVRDEEVDSAVTRVLKALEQQLDAKLRTS